MIDSNLFARKLRLLYEWLEEKSNYVFLRIVKKKNLKKKNSLHKNKIMLKCGNGKLLGKRQLTVSLKLAQSVAVVVGDVRKV
jgi:hypothetical protein